MFRNIANRIPEDKDYPARAQAIDIRNRLLDGSFYEVLDNEFHEEKSEAHEYVPVSERRPSVRSGLLRVVVEDSVSLLFDDDHFPEPVCDQADKEAQEALLELIKEMKLKEEMISAACMGAVGSVCLLLRILKGTRGYRPFISLMNTQFLTPTWDPNEPDTLLKVREQYKVRGDVLAEMGYAIADTDRKSMYWFCRDWNGDAETWYLPWPVKDPKPEQIEIVDTKEGRTTQHGLGFVPMVWIKNLPGGDAIDGATDLVPEAVDTVIQIDYMLSQNGRGLKYAMDPTLLLKEPAQADGEIVRSASNAIVVDAHGDGKLLEINGTASAAVIEYVKELRKIALEAMHGNRADADKISAAQSGRAMELMNQALIWLAGRKRLTYGEGGLLALLRMIVRASDRFPLTIGERKNVKLTLTKPISLRWPQWYAPTAQDRLNTANTIASHIDSGTMSVETAVGTIAADYDVEDVQAEIVKIKVDQQERAALLPDASQGKVTETI